MEVEGSISTWNFFDLIKQQAERFLNISNQETAEEFLIKFLQKLPNGNYSQLIKEWYKREGY